jgi:methylase of polypeptide subunit release factors
MSLGSAIRHDESLPLKQRRVQGAYYTPEAVVRYIVGETLISDLWQANSPTVLDPACGDGAFLCEVAQRLVERFGSDAVGIAQRSLFGVDCDSEAVTEARRNVARRLLGETASGPRAAQLAAKLKKNFIVADALLDPLPPKWPREFDAIVGNPPYVNIRRLANDPQTVARYRQRFSCAERGFDLYVLFIERAIELLRSGGRCGLIVPNKLATLEYAAACRQLLMERTRLETVADLSDCRVFSQASVYPQVIVFEQGAPRRSHSVRLWHADTAEGDTVTTRPIGRISQRQLNRRGVFDWQASFDVEARVPTRPLGELCRLHSGTTGFVAQELAAALRERSDCEVAACPFITSGNIDRYAIALGKVRYMKRRFLDPVLPQDCPLLTPAKRRLFAGPKIVIAGMSQRLEAAYHPGPLALGVQVFAAADWQVDPYYLLALLNSRLLSHLFRTRFAAKRLSGGYLSINKGQLAQLPVVDPRQLGVKGRRTCARIAALGKRLAADEAQADRLIEQLYAVKGSERASLDAAFGSDRPARVAA